MNKFLLLLSLVFSTNVYANILTWDELEYGKKYHVAQDIPFDENLILKANTPLVFNEVIEGGIPVIIFNYTDLNCTNTEFESEIALFNPEPEDTVNDKSIGIRYSKECQIDIYVEPKFYYGKSIFTE